MSYRLVFLETFDEELTEIEFYLNEQSDQAAAHVAREIQRHLLPLKTNPYIHPEYPDRPAFRMLVVFRYLIFYKVCEETKTVELRHIIHGARELARLLAH